MAAPVIRNEDLLSLQSYITAADPTQYANLAKSTLILDLTHSNLVQRHIEIRFDRHDTVDDLRGKIHQKTGTPPFSQHLYFKAVASPDAPPFNEIAPGCEGTRMLGFYNLQHGTNVHAVDVDPHSSSARGGYEDTSLVKKYRMTDEEYDARKGTLRDWGREMKEKDDDFSLRKHAREHAELVEARRYYRESGAVKDGFELDERSRSIVRDSSATASPGRSGGGEPSSKTSGGAVAAAEHGPESLSHLSLDSRCEVRPGGRRGQIAFLGEILELGGGGNWVGVVLDEPVGRTDGTVNGGVRYFEAPGSNRGGFFRGKNVEAGDFPEIDIMDDMEDSEDEL